MLRFFEMGRRFSNRSKFHTHHFYRRSTTFLGSLSVMFIKARHWSVEIRAQIKARSNGITAHTQSQTYNTTTPFSGTSIKSDSGERQRKEILINM